MAIKDYSTEPDMNTTISGINIAEGCAPSGINNAIRQLMADVKMEKDARDAEQSTRDAEQSTRDAAQDTAIIAAQTTAEAAQTTAEAAQTTADNKLDKSGGTMTGILKRDGDFLEGVSDASSTTLRAGTGYKKGGDITLFGTAGSSSYVGGVLIRGFDQDGTASHLFTSSKGVSINGKPVLTLTASWSDGNGNWYRKYSDGWIEQGGVVNVTTWGVAFSFPMAFTQKPKFCGTEMYTSTATYECYTALTPGSLTSTGAKCAMRDWNGGIISGSVAWYACGY